MTSIQVLGTGCQKCGVLAENANQAVQVSGATAEIVKITDIIEILNFQPPALPALAINGKVVSSGNVPTVEQIQQFLSSAGV